MAFQTICCLKNILSTLVLYKDSHFQYNKITSNSITTCALLVVFACLISSPDTYIFIGYSPSHYEYKCFHLLIGHIYISQYVIFDEPSFLFNSHSPLISTGSFPNLHTTLYPLSWNTTPHARHARDTVSSTTWPLVAWQNDLPSLTLP
jgi:hypothetical protein